MNIQAIGTSLPRHSTEVSNAARETKALVSVQENAKTEQTKQSISHEQLDAAVKSVQEYIQPFNNSLEFSVSDETKQVVVKIVDSATKQVIRQIPSEEMLAMAKTLDRIIGLFVKQKA